MLRNFFSCESDYELLRVRCLEALDKIYKEMQHWNPEESSYNFGVFGRQHLLLYGELRLLQTDDLMWKFAPKHHLFAHCTENTRGNPRDSWCYTDEDAIGQAAELARASNRAHIGRHLLEKYRITHF